jgi:Transposase
LGAADLAADGTPPRHWSRARWGGGGSTRSVSRPPRQPEHPLTGDPARPLPHDGPPRVLSVDDFALRKRHTYGTLLLDLERRRPLALLPDREASTVAQWLESPSWGRGPRTGSCAEAARLGAPAACQVADRFHLLHNLADVLTDVFRAHAPQLALIKAQHTRAPTPVHDPEDSATAPHLSAVPLAPPTAFHTGRGPRRHTAGPAGGPVRAGLDVPSAGLDPGCDCAPGQA